MDKREQMIRLWFSMWLEKKDLGMDDIFVSKMVTPRLTTIHEPAEEMGKRSAKYLIDKIEGKSRNIVNITMQPTLVERNSVRKVHSKIRR